LRAIALGRENYLFVGSNRGGERAAAIYSLLGTAKLNGIDLERDLRYVLIHIAKPHQPDRRALALERAIRPHQRNND
jgi:hypothetical protein